MRSSGCPTSSPSCARTPARSRRRWRAGCRTLVELADLRGDLHSHSDWSDGHHPIEVMAEAARARGYAYQVLTDHSQSLAIARGLTPDRVAEQVEVIAALNARFAAEEEAGTAPPATPAGGFRLLHGCELEVRADATLDFEDDLLARFDLVVASVHVARRQTRAELTQRTLNAIRSPHVDVIAHPSGRKIGQRDDLDLDWDAVYTEAARTGTALEMNGSPPRLDLAVERARRAVGLGCLVSIDSDAHDIRELDYVRWGISQARRAWITPASVLNTRSREDLLAWTAGKPDRVAAAGCTGGHGRDRRCRGRPPPMTGTSTTTSSAMDEGFARRDLALVAVTVVGLSRLLEPPLIWIAAGALLGAMLLGTLQVLHDEAAPIQAWFGVPIESVILPSVAAVACLGAIRLVPFGLWLVPALGVTYFIVIRTLALETRINHGQAGLSPDDRTSLLVTLLLVAFLAFTGVAAMVPGGLAQSGGALSETNLILLAAGDALVAGLLGLPVRVAPGHGGPRRALVGAVVRGGHRHRRRRAAGHGDRAPDRAGPADARVLPVGRVHRHDPAPPAQPALGRAVRAARRVRHRRGRLEPPAPVLTGPARLTCRPDGARKHVRPRHRVTARPPVPTLLRTPPRPERTTAT